MYILETGTISDLLYVPVVASINMKPAGKKFMTLKLSIIEAVLLESLQIGQTKTSCMGIPLAWATDTRTSVLQSVE